MSKLKQLYYIQSIIVIISQASFIKEGHIVSPMVIILGTFLLARRVYRGVYNE